MKGLKPTISIAILCALASPLFAFITESDEELNECIKKHTPIYSSQKRVEYDYWPAQYEFSVALENAVQQKVTPHSTMDQTFLGYKGQGTKVKLICSTIHPTTKVKTSSRTIATMDLKPRSENLFYTISAEKNMKQVEILINIAYQKKNIKVKDSGSWGGFLKSYEPASVYNVAMTVRR